MKRLPVKRILLMLAAVLALGGCSPAEGGPSSTSLLGDAPELVDPNAQPEAVEVEVQPVTTAEPFDAAETLLGLPLQSTRQQATQLLGEPDSQLDLPAEDQEYWSYGDFTLRYDRNEQGDKLLCAIFVSGGARDLIRGIRIGDDMLDVLDAFYRDLTLADEFVDGVTALYRNEKSRDGLLLPPSGAISATLDAPITTLGETLFAQDLSPYDTLIEYTCPAQPYPDSLLSGDQGAYLQLPHHVLRFYCKGDKVLYAEMSYEIFAPNGEPQTTIRD